jgi:hypothetical protein
MSFRRYITIAFIVLAIELAILVAVIILMGHP